MGNSLLMSSAFADERRQGREHARQTPWCRTCVAASWFDAVDGVKAPVSVQRCALESDDELVDFG